MRDQLNRGIVPEDIDVHCLAGLIKAWFRELPSGVLDGLSPEQVLQCNTEEEAVELVKQLKPTEGALLNWAVDLMADVVEHEESNKMNARNIAMVFSPNMTQVAQITLYWFDVLEKLMLIGLLILYGCFVQMSDPLTALMHAVQVMNLLKTLITKTLRERDEAGDGGYSPSSSLSSERQSDEEEYDSQQEMETSCESASEEDEERDEVESLSEIEECFLRQLNENQNAKKGFCKQLEGILCRDQESGSSPFNADSSLSVSDSRVESSFFSTSDGEDSRMSSTVSGLKMAAENQPSAAIQELHDVVNEDMDMDMDVVDNVVGESVIMKQLHVPDAAV